MAGADHAFGELGAHLRALYGRGTPIVALCAAVPGYGIALVAFAVAGVVSAVLFAASLAVRSTYAPAPALRPRSRQVRSMVRPGSAPRTPHSTSCSVSCDGERS